MPHELPTPQVLLSGLVIGESPRWHEDRLWFCNWKGHENENIAVDADGNSEVVGVGLENQPHSIEWLPDGRQLIVPRSEKKRGLLLRREPDGTVETHADLRDLAAGGANEIVVDGRGNVYVNHLGFDFLGFLQGKAEFAPGNIALVTPDGSVRQVADGIEFPNGMVVTPDNSTLIISESFAGRLTAFDIDAGGGLSNRRVWADGLGPDGICMDAEGAIWTSSGEKDCVRVREGGEITHRVALDRNPFACMLGGPDGRTLFVMAAEWRQDDPFGEPHTGQVQTVPVPVPKAGWP